MADHVSLKCSRAKVELCNNHDGVNSYFVMFGKDGNRSLRVLKGAVIEFKYNGSNEIVKSISDDGFNVSIPEGKRIHDIDFSKIYIKIDKHKKEKLVRYTPKPTRMCLS